MNLTTTYLGLTLKSPLVPSAAAPLSESLDQIRRLEDAGASAIVLHSLFEEQLIEDQFELHHRLNQGSHTYAESLTYFHEPDVFHVGPELYLDHIRSAKAAVDVPIIASLNGYSSGSWVDFARLIETAGADAIELNWYNVCTDLNRNGAEIEAELIETVTEVKQVTKIPIAVKLSPYFTNLSNVAKRLDDAGADGLVLFNRFLQPDIDPENLDVSPVPYLSSVNDMRLPLRWIAILYGRIRPDLAATSGVQHGIDVVKLLMAGAKVTQVCSSLLRHGVSRLHQIETELNDWLESQGYESIQQLQGSMSQRHCPDPTAYERAQYLKTVQSYRRSIPTESSFRPLTNA